MRFLPDGPNIPDELLESRDQGNVVFLCGAGVSYPAGMPDFLGLARYVVNELGAPEDAPSRAMLSRWDDENIPTDARPSLDQIFNLLQQEYAASEIDYLIAERLKTKSGANVTAHKTILRLSKSVDGKSQIVTTNFDLLFEKAAGRKLTTYVPPALPDLAGEQSFNGLVYLHGRINPRIKRGEGRQGFVVSSSDFGRAYLAEGWATRFIRDLLDRYIVVLLGYSANDPPVRYLLQGLHTRGHGPRATLFAFDSGTEEEVRQRWRDGGVRALAYPATDDAHSVLWDTLSAWSERADDHLAWRKQVVALSRKGPRNLAPHERGQVASLVRTYIGAKLFADADPPPSGEWLCVFDKNVRYGEVGRSFLVEYRLDDDPPGSPGDDLLSLRSTDRPTNASTRLSGIGRQSIAPLPPRLVQLAEWIVKIAHEPVAPWWAAKYTALHPYLLNRIEWRVKRLSNEFPPLVGSTWRLLIEKFRIAPDDDLDSPWYETCERIKTEGWTNSVLREFERNSVPYLTTKPPLGLDGSRPPVGDWSKIRQNQIADFDVAFPMPDELPEIPDDILTAVYQVLRRHLELAAGLLADIGTIYWETPTFYPEDKPGENYLTDGSAYLFWFRGLFDRMVETQPELVRADVALWPKEEPFFFDKLHLYAWTFDVLFSGDEVGDGLLSFSNKAFWKPYDRRELLHLLRARWCGLPSDKRQLLERRLVNGRARCDHESEEDYNRSRSIESATILGWLMNRGCELSDDTQDILPVLLSADPRWRPEWDEAADESHDGGGGYFEVDSDPFSIIDAPLGQIIPLAKEHTRLPFGELTQYKPFDGLVKQRPSRAVAALTNAARQGDYPVKFWDLAMQNWPDGARHRLAWLFGARLARLPSKIVVELRHNVFWWLEKHLPKLAVQDQPRALSILDALLDRLFEGETEATGNGIGKATGLLLDLLNSQKRGSRNILTQAIDSPVGKATELLLDLLNSQKPGKGSGLPLEIKSRLERLIAAPGEGSDHAVCIVARQLRWLDFIDPEWVRSTVVPWFNLEHPAAEAAWEGFLYDSRLPEAELFSLLKPHFLKAFVYAARRN